MVSVVPSTLCAWCTHVHYNSPVIVQQNGGSLMNLINTTLPDNVACTSAGCEVQCSNIEETMTLTLSPHNMSLTVLITVDDEVLLDRNFISSPHVQNVNYTASSSPQQLAIYVEVVSINKTHFYMLHLNVSSMELRLPLTSVPFICHEAAGRSENQKLPMDLHYKYSDDDNNRINNHQYQYRYQRCM